jgi:sensor histidine kinase regulating citrate/malate metabolism
MVAMCTISAFVDLTLILSTAQRVQFWHFLSELCICGLSVFLYFVFEQFQIHAQQELQNQIAEKRFAQQEHQMRLMQAYQSEMRKITHDFKKHINVLRGLSNDERTTAVLRQYISEYTDSLETVLTKAYTGIPSLDALLSINEAYAMAHDIRISFHVSKLGELIINPVDLNIIVGNALDNAIEACERLPDTMERYVKLGLSSQDDAILMMIMNSSLPIEHIYSDSQLPKSSKENRRMRGIGLEAIRDTIEKYGGIVDFEYSNNKFTMRARFWNSTTPPCPPPQ